MVDDPPWTWEDVGSTPTTQTQKLPIATQDDDDRCSVVSFLRVGEVVPRKAHNLETRVQIAHPLYAHG